MRVICLVQKATVDKLLSTPIVLNRLDLITMLQVLRINNGAVEVDASIMGGQQDGKKAKVPLNSRFIKFSYSDFRVTHLYLAQT